MDFTTGRTYRFVSRKGWKTREVESANKSRELVYLRRVGRLALFKSTIAEWKKSFTREQLADFTVTEVRK